MSMHQHLGLAQSTEATTAERLNAFRHGYYHCLTARDDTLLELTDALLCAQGKIMDLAHLLLEPEHQRGYGALYDGINHGQLYSNT